MCLVREGAVYAGGRQSAPATPACSYADSAAQVLTEPQLHRPHCYDCALLRVRTGGR